MHNDGIKKNSLTDWQLDNYNVYSKWSRMDCDAFPYLPELQMPNTIAFGNFLSFLKAPWNASIPGSSWNDKRLPLGAFVLGIY